jgi:heterodisulfide reductase subunit A-like polyferredoxin
MLEEKDRYIIEFDDIPRERAHMPELPADERVKNFEEIEKGFTPEQAQEEALRCLSCRRCLGCKLCLAACEKDAIVFDQVDEIEELEVDSIIITPGVLQPCVRPDERFGYGGSLNVLTDLEFEGMLHGEGPYGGLILRPSDGEIPQKIGFIFHDEKDTNRDGLGFLFKEIATAGKKIEGSELWLFSSHPVEEMENYKGYLEEIPHLTRKTAVPESVVELEDSGTLVVEYREEGEKRTERFQMIVIAAQRKLSDSIKALDDQLDLKLAQQVNARREEDPLQTGKDGILVGGGITTR